MAGISSSEASAGSMGVSSMMIGVRNKYCFPKTKVERNSKQRHTRTPPQSDGVTKIEEFLGGRQFELLVTSFLVIGAINSSCCENSP
jgi:hypothetical protein